jgi:alkylation response protein AidB-like acyl-CoA dehydrogenase
LANAYCSDVTVRAAEEKMKLHGGIGFTWEHSARLLLKRVKSAQLVYGTPRPYRSRLAHELAEAPR